MKEPLITDWDLENNPYLVEFAEVAAKKPNEGRLYADIACYEKRMACVRKYGFSIPTHEALMAVVNFSPHEGLIEIGAGTGYWSHLFQKLGAKVRAFDPRPGGSVRSTYSFQKAWTTIEEADHTILKTLPFAREMTLFISWPDYDEDWGAQALDLFPGNTFVYIGEGWSGCTGNDRFHQILSDEWTAVANMDIPSWPGIHDWLEVYRRK